ncbi:MAG: translation elongation factor Ts [Bdellovibrionales bacterium]|nr:translation elongation factor Ts [Bdellovibrionales bacterium]
MSFSASTVKDLRERTGAGMMDCKKALSESEGDVDKAIEWLRKKGLSSASKKAGRVAAEGAVASYIHGEGRIGVLLEVNSETDFVARNEGFQNFVRDIALHIAAAAPLCVTDAELGQDLIDKETEILKAKAVEEGKKPEFLGKIIEGQIAKWKKDKVLLSQPFVKNPDITISDYLTETIAKIGENIVIRRFVRFELGEGIEKKKDNFAEEVAQQLKG